MNLNNVIVSLFCGLIGAVLFTSIYNHVYQKHVGVIALQDIIASHIDEKGINDISDAERDFIAKRFGAALDQSVKEISEENNVILLVSPAVVSKAPDYTNMVKFRIEEILNE